MNKFLSVKFIVPLIDTAISIDIKNDTPRFILKQLQIMLTF